MNEYDHGVPIGEIDGEWTCPNVICDEGDGGWVCTLRPGHRGGHVAHYPNGEVCSRWPGEPDWPDELKVPEGL